MKKPLIVVLFISANLFGQNKMDELIKACKEVESIEYTIHQKNAKGYYGGPIIKATIFQQKAKNVKDVGFGNALIKATGTIKERGILKAFAFSYDGKSFQFEKGKSGIKKYNKLTQKNIANLLQPYLIMIPIRSFSENKPYKPMNRGFSEYKYAGEEVIKDESYYKINAFRGPSYAIIKGKKYFREKKLSGFYWIDKETMLPAFFTDNFLYKTIKLKQLNKHYNDSFFSLLKKNTTASKERNYQETQEDIYGKDLLKVNTMAPKWSGVSQTGKKFSLESLKGKVVVIDFWGTWCGPCRVSMPKFEELQKMYKNKSDVVIIGISAKEKDKNKAEQYFRSKGFTYVHIPNGDDIANVFKVRVYPTVYVINKEGKIVQSVIDYDIDDFERTKRMVNKYSTE